MSEPEPERQAPQDPLDVQGQALLARARAAKLGARDERRLQTYLLLRCAQELEHVCDALNGRGGQGPGDHQ